MKFLVPVLALFLSTSSFSREFCSESLSSSELWTKSTVQQRVFQAAETIKDDLFSAYMTSYIPMTFQRDLERCNIGGALSSESYKKNLIGDHLANVMSRFHVSQTLSCIENENSDNNFISFCEDVRKVRRENSNSLNAMLLATANYLSSHMSQSLLAVILDDSFWMNYPNHKLSSNWKAELSFRIKEVRSYKDLYDKNNAFLAKHIETVLNSLTSGCYIKNDGLTTAAQIAEKLNLAQPVFKLIRDKTFETAIYLADKVKKEEHPMLEVRESLSYIAYGNYKPWKVEPDKLKKLKFNTQFLFHPPGISVVTKALGALTQNQYNQRTSCQREQVNYFN